jgi:hypothetical protein
MLSSYWMPLLLLGLHGFLDDRRPRWLVLLGVSWILQALCNGYFILFGAVLIALWLAYFCSTRESWRAAPAILVTWVVSSLPLVPILFEYHAVHDFYGMRRTMGEVVEFSAPAAGWTEVSQIVWLWSRFLPDFEDNLFPGVTAVLLIFGGALLALRRSPRAPATAASRRVLVRSLAIATAAAISTILATLVLGPWRMSLAGITVRVTDLERAVTVAIACGLPLLLLTTRIRAALARRSAFVFYVAVTLVMAVLSCGPLLRAGKAVVFDPMPYRWLMYLPGFDQLRVPTRFWMLGILCLAVAAGVAFARHVAARRTLRPILVAIVAAGLLLDGWTRGFTMAPPPDPRAKVERRDRSEPILELPIGPEWDPAATYRSLRHRRRVVNGVSGYDPPHYWALRAGLDSHDPDMLGALSTLGSYDVIVDGAADPQGAWARYVSAAAGPPVGTDGTLALYQVAGTQAEEVTLGRALPIVAIRAHAHDPAPIVDGRADTEWMDGSQRPGQWVIVDLGSARDVGGVTHSLGEHPWDFPRRLVIEVSLDGASWAEVWNGPTGGMAFLAAVRAPRESPMRLTFTPHAARFVRLRTLAEHVNLWRIAELSVHEPH